jgi:hypothetical protein
MGVILRCPKCNCILGTGSIYAASSEPGERGSMELECWNDECRWTGFVDVKSEEHSDKCIVYGWAAVGTVRARDRDT